MELGYAKLQKWTKHIIILEQNRIIYIQDKKIIKGKSLNFIPIISGLQIQLGKMNDNFLGNIRQLNLIPYPQQINNYI